MATFQFEGLEGVDWSTLHHAYGPADDVPEMLRMLAGDGRASRAFDRLFTSLCHQGTVYSATSAVIPFLFQLLKDGRQRMLIHFLAAAAEARQVAISAELNKGVPVVVKFLSSDDPEEREAAAQILGAVTDGTEEAAAALNAQLAVEEDDQTRAALSEALSRLDDEYSPDEDASPLQKFRTAYSVAERKGVHCDEQTIQEMIRHWGQMVRDEESDSGVMVSAWKALPARSANRVLRGAACGNAGSY